MLPTLDVLRPLVEAKVEEAVQPLQADAEGLRDALDVYLLNDRKEHERLVLNSVLATLGQEGTPPSDRLQVALESLRGAWERLCLRVPALAPPVAVPPRYLPLGECLVPPLPPAPPEPSKLDIAHGWSLLNEIETLSHSSYRNENPVKLTYLLQALTAECRMVQEALPHDHPLGHKLGETGIRTLGSIRGASKVQGFISGLAFGAKDDWKTLAAESRRKYANFQEAPPRHVTPPKPHFGSKLGDVLRASLPGEMLGAPPPPKPKVNPKKKDAEPKVTYEWPALPLLRATIKDNALLIAGKYRQDDEKLGSIADRFGIEAEWAEVDHDSPRSVDAIATRISKGNVGALILLEGFMRHDTWARLSKAATTHGVPWAMADRGGIGSFDQAIQTLEGKLTQAAKTG